MTEAVVDTVQGMAKQFPILAWVAVFFYFHLGSDAAGHQRMERLEARISQLDQEINLSIRQGVYVQVLSQCEGDPCREKWAEVFRTVQQISQP